MLQGSILVPMPIPGSPTAPRDEQEGKQEIANGYLKVDGSIGPVHDLSSSSRSPNFCRIKRKMAR